MPAVAALFRRGADPDARDGEGQTAAQVAAAAGNADCVTLLRLASLAAGERGSSSAAGGGGGGGDDALSFANILEDFSRNLAEKRGGNVNKK